MLGSDAECAKGGDAHYDRLWDSASDRDDNPQPLLAAGATHIVRALADILPIVTAA